MTAAFAVAALVGLVGIAAVFDAHAAVAGREFFAVVAELLHFAVKVFFLDFAVVAVVVAAFEAADLRFGGVFVDVYALFGGGAVHKGAHGGDLVRAKQRGGKVWSVGTTSLRAIESAARSGSLKAGQGDTDIFITPGFQFQVIDRLITNFHLPKSTLLMLVSAFSGCDKIRAVYRHAVAQEYRFFSYGDAMILGRETAA